MNYNRMNVVRASPEEDAKPKPKPEQEEEEQGEQEDADNEQEQEQKQEQGQEGGEQSQPQADEKQLASMMLTVWALLIIGIIVFIAGSIVKGRDKTETKYVNTASGMYDMDSLVAEDKQWTDTITVQKKVQCNGNTVAFYLVGEATTYGKVVYVPVTEQEFNSVSNGEMISIVFSRLNISGKENILIKEWSKS